MTENNPQLQSAIKAAQFIKSRLAQVVIGQDTVIEQVLTAFLAGGHVLLEGVPGVGKTLLVRTLANTFSGSFNRIQFTPDLMPSDVTGHYWFDAQQQKFELRAGPVFTHLLLADEINRAPAKTQAALLEVMQEGSVTLDGNSHQMPQPFMVLATQNPIEQEGTYPLPEAQLDRFMFKILMDYPSATEENQLLKQILEAPDQDLLATQSTSKSLTPTVMQQLQHSTQLVHIAPEVVDYVVRLVGVTRTSSQFAVGAGPRASIALLVGARAYALVQGMTYVTPEHIKALWLPTLRHRVRLSIALEMEGQTIDQVLLHVTQSIAAPRP